MTSTGDNNLSTMDGIYGSSTLDRNDPFPSEGHDTTKFIGGGCVNKFDFHTIKAANVSNSKRSNRYDLSKNELLHMLCYLEGELQARDVVIAALRNERVKQYIHALRVKKLDNDDPHAALFRDKATISGNNISRQSSAAAIQADYEVRSVIEQQIESLHQVITRQRQTQARMISFLSDSLENNQRMRQELEEEKRKHEHDTAQGDDITYGLEMERTKLKQELETERNNRKKLEKDVKKAQELLEFERGRQKQIVLLLLAERKKIIMKYIEERKRSEDLAQILSEEKQRSDSIAEGLEEESKKSLRMEAELEKQALTIENERKTWKINFVKEEKRLKEMELELIQLRNENEAFRKQITLRMGGGICGVGGGDCATPPVIVGSGSGATTIATKVRDETAGALISSSFMNVSKIIQPTATVSSVPVSGPTTGIARSISPGQCLRQQAIGNCGDHILGGSGGTLNTSSHANVTGSFNTIGKTPVATIQSTPSNVGDSIALTAVNTKLPHPSNISPIGLLSSSSALSTSVCNPQTATILRSGVITTASSMTSVGSSSLSASASSGVLLVGSNISNIGSSMGRGIPPPIPPNKPTVPPKREPSISRITTVGGNSLNNSAIPVVSTSTTQQALLTSATNVATPILSNNTSVASSTISNAIP